MKRHWLTQTLVNITIALMGVSSFSVFGQEAALLQFKENWVAASGKDVLNARCSRAIPFTDKDITAWLDAKANEDSQKVSANVYGIELTDESSYLVSLLQALITQDSDSHKPQGSFSSHCTKVNCVARELFGDRVGLQLLFMLGRFGFNGSHLRVDDSSPWTSPELDTILLALSDLPKELIPSSPLVYNRRLTHYRRRQPNPDRSDSLASTNIAGILVYDSWNEYSIEMQRYALFHELGHIFGYDSGLHSSQSWHETSGWIKKGDGWFERDGEPAVSKYAEGNPIEDFAESFSAYRYNPKRLKEVTPRAYDLIKTQVFKDTEFTKSAACSPLYPESPEELAVLEQLKRSVLNHATSSSLNVGELSDKEIDRARQTCLSGPALVSAFVSGQLLHASARCVQGREIKKAIATIADQSADFKGLNPEWISSKLYPQVATLIPAPTQCTQNCQHLAQTGLSQMRHALELVLTGYMDLGNEQERQPAQKFCTELSSTNIQAARGYPEIQSLTGDGGTDDLIHASVKVCKAIQNKLRKRQSMSAEQIEAELKGIYPEVSSR